MLRFVLLVALVTIGLVLPADESLPPSAAAQDATPAADCPVPTEDENQAIVQRYYDLVNAFNLEGLKEVYAPVVIQHAADVPDAKDADEAIANIGIFLVAFPDLHSEVDQWVTDGDLVAARVVQGGTQQEDFLGVPASDKEATWTVLGIFRIECGRIAEQWVEVDQISRLQQLGAIDLPGGSSAAPAVEADAAPLASPPADCPATTEEENADLIGR